MKTIKNLAAAAIAAFLCIGFTACGPTENQEPKLLDKWTISVAGVDMVEYTFSYDKNGNVTSLAFSVPAEQMGETLDCVWDKNTVKMFYDGEEVCTYTISDGLVRSFDRGGDDVINYAYNSSGQLISCTDGGLEATDFSWQGKKLTRLVSTVENLITDETMSDTIEFTYGNQTCKGYIPLLVMLLPFDVEVPELELAMAQPEIFGVALDRLPESITGRDGTALYSYRLNKAGYVENITMLSPDLLEMLGSLTVECHLSWK